jgi:hypothetical protein
MLDFNWSFSLNFPLKERRSIGCFLKPKLIDSIGSQESIEYNFKGKSMPVISTQWVNTFLVIPAKAGIQK